MRNVALDLGNRITFARAVDGEVVQHQVAGSIEELRPLLGPDTEKATVAIEACREAWHVYDTLRGWGHEVLLVDTTRVRELGIGHHRRKNDRIDAGVLALGVEKGNIPQAHVLSPSRRAMREQLGLRKSLTKTRANYAIETKGLLRAHGVRVAECNVENLPKVVASSCHQPALLALVQPLLASINDLTPRILDCDARLELLAQDEPCIQRLKTMPGVATVVAVAFVSVIDDAKRFKSAHEVEAYLGLVPSENSSGNRRLGSITKQGNGYLRALLVSAGWTILRVRGFNPLKVWAQAVERRRGKRVAAVALARRIAGILWAVMRDGTVYEAERVGMKSAAGIERAAGQSLAVAAQLRRAAQSEEVVTAALNRARSKIKPRIRNRVRELNQQHESFERS